MRTTKIMFGNEQRLPDKGVTPATIVDNARELSAGHGMEAGEVRDVLHTRIVKSFNDPDVSSLVPGTIFPGDELYWIRKNSETKDNPVFLLAHEIIGIAPAECISGTYARFEFNRYYQKKPGIPGTPGRFPDDAVAAEIIGCISRPYTECFECT